MNQLKEWVIKRIPRIENVQVDALAGVVAMLPIKEVILLPIHLQTVSSITVTPICNAREIGAEWTHEIENYLLTRDLPKESKRAHKIWVQAACFTLIGDCLYRRSFGDLYLRYLDNVEA